MAKKALLRGNAGNYSIRGTVWELGSFAYRAYLHLIPTLARSTLSRWVVSADGMSVKEVLGAVKARVRTTVGTTVSTLEVVPNNIATSEPDTKRRRRFPPPTD